MPNDTSSTGQNDLAARKQRIQRQLQDGRNREAQEEARALCAVSPDDDEAQRLRGTAALANNDLVTAALAYCEAIRLNDAQDNDIFRTALILSVEHGLTDRADDVAAIAVSVFPDDMVLNAYSWVVRYAKDASRRNVQELRNALRMEPHQWGSFYAAYADAMTEHGLLQEAADDLIQAEEALRISAPTSSARSSALHHAAHFFQALGESESLRRVLVKLNGINPGVMPQMRPLWEWLLTSSDGAASLQEIDNFAKSCNETLSALLSGSALPEAVEPLGIQFLVNERYRFFAVDCMDAISLESLAQEGLSAAFLSIVNQDESIYINAISPPLPGKGWRHDAFVSPRVRDVLDTLDAGEKTVLSPLTGTVTTSSHMLSSEVFTACDNGVPFIVTQWAETDMCMTDTVWIIPHLEIVLYLARTAISGKIMRQKVCDLYEFVIRNKEQVRDSLAKSCSGFIVAQPEIPHIGHYIWNAISGLSPFFKYCAPDQYPAYFATYDNVQMVGDVRDLYRDFYERHSEVKTFADLPAANLHVIESGSMLLTLKDNYITDDLANRVIRTAYAKAGDQFVHDARAFRSKCHPLLLITLRLGNRAWQGQRNSWPLIFKSLAREFGSVGFILDGINCDITQGWTHGMMSIQEEISLAESITASCGSEIPILNSIGCSASESIVLADLADAFVAPVGAGMAKYRWITNLPGVAFSNKSFSKPESRDGRLYDNYREYARKAVHIDQHLIEDCDEPSADPGRSNFSMDWSNLHQTIRTFLIELQNQAPLRNHNK